MDDESAESVLEQLAALEQYVALRVAILARRFDAAAVAAVERQWRRYFLALNLEPAQCADMCVSYTDVGFVALCHAWASAPGELFERGHALFVGCSGAPLDASCLAAIHAELVVVSCQHTLLSRRAWPSAAQIWALRRRVARAVVRFLDTGRTGRASLVTQLASVVEQPPSELLQERRTPQLLLRAQLEARQKREREGAPPEEDASEEASGALWRSSPQELAASFVRLASRVFYKLDSDTQLVAAYPAAAAPSVRPQALERLRQWVRARCRVEQTDEMTKAFRDFANASWCPLGTETARYRSRETRSDVTAPLQMLEGELGMDLGQHLHDRSLAQLSELAADADGLFWDALLLTLFAQALFQSVRMDWRSLCLHAHAHTLASQAAMADVSMDVEKRPLVVLLERRWRVLHRQQLMDCDSLAHALLCWMQLVRSEFGSQGERTEDLTAFLAGFLDGAQ